MRDDQKRHMEMIFSSVARGIFSAIEDGGVQIGQRPVCNRHQS